MYASGWKMDFRFSHSHASLRPGQLAKDQGCPGHQLTGREASLLPAHVACIFQEQDYLGHCFARLSLDVTLEAVNGGQPCRAILVLKKCLSLLRSC